jgi:FKBP-type peptidyl-prolyl cis-trans isomerase
MKPILAATAALVLLAGAAHAQPKAAALPPSTAAEKAFFAKNAKAPGVVALPGLQYEVLKSGPAEGAHPKGSDEITVRYRGAFTDGKVFDTSPDDGAGTSSFVLNRLIPGWGAALRLMRPGDVWKLYLPAYLAYGPPGKGEIPPGATLVFQIELVSAAPPAPQPKPPS